ncbi:amino acid ABC transporter permease [Jeongeupia chitinilytica]|uniref:ABC transporter permease n=1 Tax=Jeongeupia chitinilytica TaxID=1041641 RepID=A0ABQ3GYF7_9NEIS|nr:amino acid ABC transporter permease [Jeongeupia chitinilytica]GHD58551.1 ABC transporter permease [Jeongeupia chitinilytica]
MMSSLFPGLLDARYLFWLLKGFGLTLQLSLITIVLATLLGLLVAAAREQRWLAVPCVVYLSVMRNTPLLVQLFFWYFGAASLVPEVWMVWLNTPKSLLGVPWPSFEWLAALFGLTLYSAAFIAEEIRAGIRGVGRGQRAAAAALGLTGWQAFRWVILPQALRIARGPLFGQYMNVVKNSSLAMAIGLAELSYASRQVETETLKTFQAFGVATLLYMFAVMLVQVAGRRRAA